MWVLKPRGTIGKKNTPTLLRLILGSSNQRKISKKEKGGKYFNVTAREISSSSFQHLPRTCAPQSRYPDSGKCCLSRPVPKILQIPDGPMALARRCRQCGLFCAPRQSRS